MISNFHYRFLLVITFFVGLFFISSIPEMINFGSWFIWGITFFILGYFVYISFKNLSSERINEILMLDFFKKIGCDFSVE